MAPEADFAQVTRGARKTALQVAGVYLLFGAAWIFLTDWLLAAALGPVGGRVALLQTLKGLLFISATAALLFLLLFRTLARAISERTMRREVELRLRPFLEHLPGVVFLKGMDGRIIFAGGTMNGVRLDPVECFGKTSDQIWEPDEAARMEEMDRQVLADRKPRQIVSTYRMQGESHWLVHKFPVMDDRGEVVAVGGIGLDITPRVEAQEEARRLNEELRRADKLKDEFLSTLSHELRAPLTSIRLWAHLLRNADPKTQSEAIGMIEKGVEAQAHTIADLLDISKIIGGTLRLQETPLLLPELVRDAVEFHRPMAAEAGLSLQLDLRPVAGRTRGDADRLKQVVGHLLSNAIKFTPPGGTIVVALEQADSTARLSVRDTGKGISPQFLPHLFERFRQADGSLTRAHGGLGIGLAIVRHLVELHGGKVEARSDGEGKGATFVVELPLDSGGEPAAEPAGDGRSLQAPRVLEGVNVLVVEDSPETLQAVGTILRNFGACVTEAASAEQALEFVRESKPAVVVADIGLPEMDGHELIRRVRAIDPARPIKVAALSGYVADEDRDKALSGGFDQYIAKPVEPLELVAAVASLAGK